MFPVLELQHGWHLWGEKAATDGTEWGQKVPGMKHGRCAIPAAAPWESPGGISGPGFGRSRNFQAEQ